MGQISNPLFTSQPTIPPFASSEIGKLVGQGLVIHFPSAAAFQSAVTQEQANVTASSPLWADGQPMTVSGEPVGLTRRWFGGSLNHARSIFSGTKLVATLANDTNAILATTGAPTGGSSGDIAFDAATSLLYTKTGSTWDAGVSIGSSGSISGLTAGALTKAGSGTSVVNSSIVEGTGGVGVNLPTRVPGQQLETSGGLGFDLVLRPATLPTLAVNGAAGNVNSAGFPIASGDVSGSSAGISYAVTYYTATGKETSISNTSAFLTGVVNGRIDLTNIPVSPDPRVVGRKIYRSTQGSNFVAQGQPTFWLAATIADNTTTTWQDNLSDVQVQSSLQQAPYDNATGGRVYQYDNIGQSAHIQVSRSNMFLGYQAGHQSDLGKNIGFWNYGIGFQSLNALTVGFKNVAIGNNSMISAVNAAFNTGVGPHAIQSLVGGRGNSGLGHSALQNLKTADSNTSIGMYAAYNLGIKSTLSYLGFNISGISDYSATVAGTVKVTTAAAHTYQVGDLVRQEGTWNYNGVQTIVGVIDAFNYYYTGNFYSAETSGYTHPDGPAYILNNVHAGYYAGQTIGFGQNNSWLGAYTRYNANFGEILYFATAVGAFANADLDNVLVLGGNGNTNGAGTVASRVKVSIGASRPVLDFGIEGNAAKTIGIERNIATTGAGNDLKVVAGGAARQGAILPYGLAKTPTAGGTGYRVGDTVTIGSGGAKARVIQVVNTVSGSAITASGVVVAVQLLDTGSGYTVGTGQATTAVASTLIQLAGSATPVAPATSTGTGLTVNITAVAASSNLAGGNAKIASGPGTGTGSSGIQFLVHPPGTTGTADTTETVVATLDATGFKPPLLSATPQVSPNAHWHVTGVPSNSLGANGDTAMRTDGATGAFLYQKRAGAWVASAA